MFGVDEEQDFKEVGVYDPQDIQKKINEQCLQMEPVVRPLLTVAEKNGLFFGSRDTRCRYYRKTSILSG